jgi:hypothetical protein
VHIRRRNEDLCHRPRGLTAREVPGQQPRGILLLARGAGRREHREELDVLTVRGGDGSSGRRRGHGGARREKAREAGKANGGERKGESR